MNAEPNRRAFTWGRAGAFAVSFVLLWFVFRRIDLAALHQALKRLQLGWYALTLAAFGLATVLAAARWHLMLRLTGCSVHPAASFRMVLIGHFFNTLLFGPAGGDVAKSALYGRWCRRPVPEVLAASFLDRLLGAGGSVLLGLLTIGLAAAGGALAVLSQLDLSRGRGALLAGAGVVVLVGALIWRRPWKHDSALGQAVRALMVGMTKLASAPAVLVKGLLLGLLVQIFWCGLLALSLKSVTAAPVPWGALIWTFPVIGMAASAPVTFAGAGVREGTALFLLGLYGVPRVDAVAAAMLTLLAYFLWAALGGWLLWRGERRFRRHDGTRPPG